jgi:hypothetical protein
LVVGAAAFLVVRSAAAARFARTDGLPGIIRISLCLFVFVNIIDSDVVRDLV